MDDLISVLSVHSNLFKDILKFYCVIFITPFKNIYHFKFIHFYAS